MNINKRLFLLSVLISFFVFAFDARAECGVSGRCSHGISLWDPLKYKADFTNFDYVNPDAPKGGDVKFAALGSFDSFNSHILKGVPAAGLGYLYDSLIAESDDEPFSKYGLLAKTIEIADDGGSATFYLREEAHWHDGKMITADDVVFSFNILIEKGHPYYRSYYREVEKAVKINPHTVKFVFKTKTNRELPLILGQIPILPKHYYSKVDFEKTTLEPPLGSGPYKVDSFEPGKWIKYKRAENYWAKDLPVNRGVYNFDTITYDYYRDATVAVEAFKAGEYDFRDENVAKTWATAYNIPQVKDGRIIKEELIHERPTGMQGFVFNTRREKFSDPRVRKAISYAFDFEWANKNLFYDSYTRTESYFSNSEFASRGLPKGLELDILNKYKDKLPPRVFTKEYKVPSTDGSGNNRENLIEARDILKKAGWVVNNEGVLVNKESGEKMEIEFMLDSPTFERVLGPMMKNLKKLGIKASIRTVDGSQYIKRLEDFDFDMIAHVFPQSLSPGNEQQDYWHSSRAFVNGTRNLPGVRDSVVDALVDNIIKAPDKATLVASTRALDRVLLNGYYVIPNWHIKSFRILYWDKFERPKQRGKYMLGLETWWMKEPKNRNQKTARE